MPIGYTNLKSVQQDRDAVREQLSPVSWGGGNFIKDPQILDNANVATAAGLIGTGGGDTTALEAQIASLQAQLIQSQADLAQAQAALAIAEAQNAADAITIAALQAQVTSLQNQITSLQAQVTSLQAQAAADAATIASLQGQVATLTAQVTSLQSQVTTLTAQVASLQAQLSKIFKAILIDVYAESGGGIYVPPVYDNLTIDFTSYVRLNPYIINTYASTGGGYP